MALLDRLSITQDGTVNVGQDTNGNGVLEWAPLATQAYVTDADNALAGLIVSIIPVSIANGSYNVQFLATPITANADGLTSAIIPDNTSFVTVTSGNSAHLVTLPTPAAGLIVRLMNGGTAYNIRSSTPASVGINGGTGAAVKSAISANVYVELMCVSATAWIGRQYTTAGVQTAVAVAS